MEKITSFFDFLQKVKKDKRYERLIIYTYKKHTRYSIGDTGNLAYELSKNWVIGWIKCNPINGVDDCKTIIDYLNSNIEFIIYRFPNEEPPDLVSAKIEQETLIPVVVPPTSYIPVPLGFIEDPHCVCEWCKEIRRNRETVNQALDQQTIH